MTDYQVTVKIDDDGVEKIKNSAQLITFSKNATSTPAGSLLAYCSFQPGNTLVLQWTEKYYLFAAAGGIQEGKVTATSISSDAVQEGWIYTFQDGQFTGTPGDGTTYNVTNQMTGGDYGFGLTQYASINNINALAPINVVSVLYNETASFTPEEKMSVYLSSDSTSGTVISSVTSIPLVINLSSASPSATVSFDTSSDTFHM